MGYTTFSLRKTRTGALWFSFNFFSASESTGTLACCCGPDSPSDSIRMFPDRPTDHKVEEETIKGNRVRAREVMVEWWWFTRFIFRLHQRLQSTFLSHLFLCCFAYKIINCSGYRYLVTYNLATYSLYNIILLTKLEIETYYHDIKHYLLHLLQDFVA